MSKLFTESNESRMEAKVAPYKALVADGYAVSPPTPRNGEEFCPWVSARERECLQRNGLEMREG